MTLLLALLFSAVPACTPSARLRPPDDFAALEGQKDFVMRAANPDGVVIAVRREANKPAGSLKFWCGMLDAKLQKDGYRADGAARDVTTTTGVHGQAMHYQRVEHGRAYRYWVTVFVSGGRIWMVEAGGDAEKLNGATGGLVEQAMSSVFIG